MIKENLENLIREIPKSVKLVAVSKLNSVERVMDAYNCGQRVFGENRVQELLPKYEAMPKDIEWHLIGHLQTNKVKFIAPFIAMIQSIDSLKLLSEVNQQALKNNRIIDVLLQFHVAQEETKFGLTIEEAKSLLTNVQFQAMNNVRVCGVMGMATQTDNIHQIEMEFETIASYFKILKNDFFSDSPYFTEISMGMSHDYQLAIQKGSTIIRVGSKIFR